MRYGHHMSYGYYGSEIFILLLIIAAIVFYLIIRDAYARRTNISSCQYTELLKIRYAKGEIDSDEYRNISTIIENCDCTQLALQPLIKQFAMGELDSKEFIEIYTKMNNPSYQQNAMDVLNERYALGEISLDEFKKIKKEIRK